MRIGLETILAALLLQALAPLGAEPIADLRGRQFVGFENFDAFEQTAAPEPHATILTSPEIRAAIEFNEVILSWNVKNSGDAQLKIEARALYEDGISRYYTLGLWTTNTTTYLRQSVNAQADSDGRVATDTLILAHPSRRLQVRLTGRGPGFALSSLKFLGVSFADSRTVPPEQSPDRGAWGKIIPVPERSQMAYPNGKVLCSPATLSMLLGYWSRELERPELDRAVPEVADAVYDSDWKGAGNWAFNMAYAGSFDGIRAYVTRLSDVRELEAWIACGVPVGLSVDYDRLRAKGPGPNGHLVVCVGFTESGDPVINDPGTSQHVQKIFSRKDLINAWGCSRNTVYLVYPERLSVPRESGAHWATTKR